MTSTRVFNGPYEGKALDHLHFPLGGLGAGMFCVDGTGSLSSFSIQNRPDLWNSPLLFSAISIKDGAVPIARVLEAQVPTWKLCFPWDRNFRSSGGGAGGTSFGLPRFESARFESRFPFARIQLIDEDVPLEISITAWSPFIPGNPDDSGLPLGTLEYHFKNPTSRPIEAIYSFHSRNFIGKKDTESVTGMANGFVLRNGAGSEKPATEGDVACWTDSPDTKLNLCWIRSGWYDPLNIIWRTISEGLIVEHAEQTDKWKSNGGSFYVPLKLSPGEEKTVRLNLAWRTPYSDVQFHAGEKNIEKIGDLNDFYRPWYAEKFKSIEEIVSYWNTHRDRLLAETKTFSDCFYDSTLPPEVIEAIAANLSILKSPTVLREHGGRLWNWEGCNDDEGSCQGSCTHVWNYAQAIAHLFPSMERTLRETEFTYSQSETGQQSFRSNVPLAPPTNFGFPAAADGQLGGLMKLYRDWRISGDHEWLRRLWPLARKSLDYCIGQWDPDRRGVLVEPHHNTYDIEFWGPNGMCSSIYVASLSAAIEIGRALGDDVSGYQKLAEAGVLYVDGKLHNGEYYFQQIEWKGLRAGDPTTTGIGGAEHGYSPEAITILEKEGPKYQYGEGCLADGVIGEYLAWTAGLNPTLDPRKIEQHLVSVHKYNFFADIAKAPNTQRPAFASAHEAGVQLCTWPGKRLTLPFYFSQEVWAGVEYQVAAHLISLGHVDEGLEIVRACRSRYDGTVRNPFSEMEAGHWYGRSLASYALLQAFTGARYDAVDQILYLEPRISGDFRSFLSTATGFGTVGVKNGQPFFEIASGHVEVKKINYKACSQ
jgi:uncharacterized protein (DUF608 family)